MGKEIFPTRILSKFFSVEGKFSNTAFLYVTIEVKSLKINTVPTCSNLEF